MLTCNKHRSNFSALIDEQLEFNLKFEVQQHLNDCTECSDSLLSLRDLQAFVEKNLIASVGEVPEIWNLMRSELPPVCELIQEEFSAYLDEEVAPATQDGIDAHLEKCLSCRHHFKLLKRTSEITADALREPTEVKVDLWLSIKSQLNASCAIIATELSPFLDQEVPNPRHRNVASHILTCLNCTNSFQRLSAIGEFLKENYLPLEQRNVLPLVLLKIQAPALDGVEEPRTNYKRPLIIGGIAVAAVLALVIVGALLLALANSLMQDKPPVVTSEDYILQYCFAEPSDQLEAVINDDTN